MDRLNTLSGHSVTEEKDVLEKLGDVENTTEEDRELGDENRCLEPTEGLEREIEWEGEGE